MQQTLTAPWTRFCASSPFLRFLDENLRGVGQVMFQDNPLSGALFLVGIAWASYAAGAPEIVAGGIVALVVATMTSHWLHVDESSRAAGLYGFNGVLVGLALMTFLDPGPLRFVYVVLGAVVSVVAMLGIAHAVRPFGVSALTFPFVITTWALLLAAHAFSAVASGLPLPGETRAVAPVASALAPADFVQGVLHSISQVFLKGSGVAAVFLLAGLAVNSVPAAAFAVGGAVLAVVAAHVFGAESDLITGGLLGFSPVLTAIALGTVFAQPSGRITAYAALGVVFTVIAQAALDVALIPLAVPALTAPFVLVSWMFALPRECVERSDPAPVRARFS
ncbi:MAG: urea transporter [Blastocatellia bacterium]|nr:MAG: urea transporter [Blastocatellia bacterium]